MVLNDHVTAICDNGSSINFITREAVRRLGLSATKVVINLIGLQDEPLPGTSGRLHLTLRSNNPANRVRGTFYVVERITRDSPSTAIAHHPEFTHLNLADPEYGSPKRIDVLLGLDIWVQILDEGIIRSKGRLAVAQKTLFGWIVFQGERQRDHVLTRQVLHTSNEAEEVSFKGLEEIIKKFWEIESIPSSKLLSREEKECEQMFHSSQTRTPDGRYVVHLPFNEKIRALGSSKQIALKQFFALERKMARNPEFRTKYIEFIAEFISLGHLSRIYERKESGYYTPHHGVSSSRKFRVVFNASSPTSSGISLNDCQLVGPKLQNDLQNIFLRFRRGEIALTADIVKMYRQVEVHKPHRKYQKILWRASPTEPMGVYQLNRVVYGQASAPYLAVRAMQQCAHDHKNEFPVGANSVLNDFYVDDLLACADSIPEAQNIKNEVIELLNQGKFELSKWCSNVNITTNEAEGECIDFDYFKADPPSKNQEMIPTEPKSVLGLRWIPSFDTFVYTVDPIDTDQLWTKRKILSEVGKLYDPSGFITPVLIKAKILIQSLWTSGLEWDDPITEAIQNEWHEFIDDVRNLVELKIPRWLGMKANWQTDLHGFSDASERAYAAVVYARTVRSDGVITIQLIQSKTKVAPLKRLSVPRLELCGAYLLANLLEIVTQQLEGQFNQCHLWSDSEVTLAWIRKPPNQLKTFVGNRVAAIQTKTIDRGFHWHWVAGEDNPADLASRGISSQALRDSLLWWHGPQWLSRSETEWPIREPQVDDNVISAECRVVLHVMNEPEIDRGGWFKAKKLSPLTPLLKTCGNLNRLQRTVATFLRAVHNFKIVNVDKITGPLSAQEMEQALMKLVQMDQGQTLNKEIQICLSSDDGSNGSMWFDRTNRVLRLSGRVISENLSPDEQNPMVLSPKGDLAALLLQDAHSKTLHGGVQQVLQVVRRRFWIRKARQLAKTVIHKCTTCFRHKIQLGQQLMAELPSARTTPARPFRKCGVDYLGPIGILVKIGRSPRIVKGYVCVFVCFVTRAVHLELVSDASTAQFIQALRRMIARRGPVSDIWSDNATNFTGANNELNRLSDKKVVADIVSNRLQIHWHFITPRAPHHGGLHEAAVKSVKKHLNRVLGAQNLTYEEYATLLTQVEACVNSRPISPLSDDPSDLNALTPAHFLIGEPLVTLAEPSNLIDSNVSHLKRWQMVQQMHQNFWQRWHVEYITTLANRPKWQTRERNLQVGDLVLIQEPNTAPSHWDLGRIKEVYHGQDALVRSVLVSTIHGEYKRPITKLGLLLKNTDESIDLSKLNPPKTYDKLKKF